MIIPALTYHESVRKRPERMKQNVKDVVTKLVAEIGDIESDDDGDSSGSDMSSLEGDGSNSVIQMRKAIRGLGSPVDFQPDVEEFVEQSGPVNLPG